MGNWITRWRKAGDPEEAALLHRRGRVVDYCPRLVLAGRARAAHYEQVRSEGTTALQSGPGRSPTPSESLTPGLKRVLPLTSCMTSGNFLFWNLRFLSLFITIGIIVVSLRVVVKSQ